MNCAKMFIKKCINKTLTYGGWLMNICYDLLSERVALFFNLV